ncbi:hypothetical protein FJY84_07075, partial [Candidatus Bathyarchaeota archaeon]|nr:hypothetical protein [Candidatus Bathyarchaeota archaeon]
MKMNKLMSIFVIAAILLSAMPMVSAPSTTINISPSFGPVGTVVTVSGTLATYNGNYQIRYDRDADNTTEALLATGTATGYSYSKDVTIPSSFAGGRYIEVVDLDSDGIPTKKDWFTVLTAYTLTASASQVTEGGPITLTGKVTGAALSLNGSVTEIAVKNPSGTWIVNSTATVVLTSDGNWTQTWTSANPDSLLGVLGVYNAWWVKGTSTLATTSFTVALLSKAQYMRTETMHFQTYTAGSFTYYEIVMSNGVVIRQTPNATIAPWYSGDWYIPKDAPLGTYTLRLYNGSAFYKSATFEVIPATISIRGSINLPFFNASLMRTESQLVNVSLEYPDHTYVLAGDLGAPPTIGVYYNTTQFATLVLDGYAQSPYPVWYGVYKYPKNAPIGIGWGFNITSNTLTDRYGNKGPANYVSTGGIITVHYAILKLDNWDVEGGNSPTLVYPAAGAEIQRTLTAQGRFRIIYPDTTLYTPSDLGTLKIRAEGDWEGPWLLNYTVTLSATDYNSTDGAWTAKWKIPYNAPLTDYEFEFYTNDVVDAYGNYIMHTNDSDEFEVIEAVIRVVDLATNKPEYMSDDDLIVSFRALYPSDDPVINLFEEDEGIWVDFYGVNGEDVGHVLTKYNPSTQKYSGTWIVASGYASGTWNATVDDWSIEDDAYNEGPVADVTTTFNVVRLSLTDIWRYLHEMNATFIQCCTQAKEAIAAVQTTANTAVAEAQAAKAAAQAASTAATAAKTAADEAKASAATAITSA